MELVSRVPAAAGRLPAPLSYLRTEDGGTVLEQYEPSEKSNLPHFSIVNIFMANKK